IESLRQFDPNSQRSQDNINTLSLAPSRETTLPAEGNDLGMLLERTMSLEAARLGDEEAARLEENIRSDIDALENRVFFDRLDLYRPLIHPDSGCAMDLLGEDGLLVLDEPLTIDSLVSRAEDEFGQALKARIERGEILQAETHDYVLSPDHFSYAENLLALSSLNGLPDWYPKHETVAIQAVSLEGYRGRSQELANDIKSWLKEKQTVLVSTDQPNRAKTVLGQVDVYPQETPPEDETSVPQGAWLAEGNLAGGFTLPFAKIAVVSDHELFGVGRLKLPQRKFNEGMPIATVMDLEPGDYVVHINFGIGVYRGLVNRTVDDVEKEYLFIEYQHPDKLYVPTDQLDRVQKYLAPGDADPKVNKLRGGEWQRTVGKAREEAREFARDLIRLYAKRKDTKRSGHGYDTPWQAEMEATFPYMETPSQLTAIQEVKRDLQRDFPMDRLVCGDVGFGKTEVAIRAAFKVAQEGKQVAVLCPTTILSEQHFRNFSERLNSYPITLDYLNRFRNAKDKRDVVHKLKSGEVDIVIGTHALLNAKLEFKDLGLIIVDEEQKFGVKHKESLKKMRVNVDVLSMSATPIPRTLSMALMNIRQMSVINDPPPGRLPVRTFVRPYADEVVREALLRELARGGQVYYVFNRVQGLNHIKERIQKLVPTARIAIGHGQMTESELEPVMLAFIRGEVDVLISTTIVENGLDISNANTLIVEEADKFGLAQLYQLRGRVGRSDRQAYAYLLYSGKNLTEGATNRLQALSEFSQLGAGYSLAFRDLQIRGAGDLLGAKQSGQMTAVGYDLYTQLIDSEVKFLKEFADGSAPESHALDDPLQGMQMLPVVELPVPALIPPNYIEDEGQRLYYYKQMTVARDPAQLQEVSQEVADRYGRQPKEVQNAFRIVRTRLRCEFMGITKIVGTHSKLTATLGPDVHLTDWVFRTLNNKAGGGVRYSEGKLEWAFDGDPVSATEKMLAELDRAMQEVEEQKASIKV
ncbi:MAG: transcription-repair coupling factor, partial [Fimbriimonadaceae bacterium]